MNIEYLKLIASQVKNYNDLTSLIKTDPELHSAIVKLSSKYLNRRTSGCVNCMADAFTELITLKDNIIMDKDKLVFRVRNGALLFDPETGVLDANTLTASTITNDLALYHISKRGEKVLKYFTKLPDNLDELLAEFAERQKPVEALLDEDDTEEAKAAKAAELARLATEEADRLAAEAAELAKSKAEAKAAKAAEAAAAKEEAAKAAATAKKPVVAPVAAPAPATEGEGDAETVTLITDMLLEGVEEKTILESFDFDVSKIIASIRSANKAN